MGLLDDLEQESERRKAGLDDVGRQKQERETLYKTQLDPAMQALYEFLARLVNNLKFLKPRTASRYEIPGYGPVPAYVDHEYELKINAQQLAKEITLNFNCVVAGDECPTVEVQGVGKVKAMNAMFQKFRLAGLTESKKDEAGEISHATYKARGKIPLAVAINADADSAAVRMSFTNFEALGTVTKSVAPAQFNDQLFDDLARMIAREPSGLFREVLPDEFRKQLQQKVQKEQLRRKWETKIASQQKEELEHLRREQSLKGKVERTMEGVKQKAPGLLGRVKGIFKKT